MNDFDNLIRATNFQELRRISDEVEHADSPKKA